MRSKLAERLLAKTMNWTADETSRERPLLQALANFKYDEYQQYSPGIRFMESLAQWLAQFKLLDERKVVYNFIKTKLIFFSNDQITHLVNITYGDKIQPILINKTAQNIGIKNYLVNQITTSQTFKTMLRRSLFIGLSDGSRIDQLRRSYTRISNEQVLSTYSISSDKIKDMVEKLKESKIKEKFNTAFLIDDFTASGTSYFVKDDGKWKGKICKFIKSVFDGGTTELIQTSEPFDIHIVFYIATEDAIKRIKSNIELFKSENVAYNFNYTVQAVQLITSDIKDGITANEELLKILENYFDSSIVDSHFKKGIHDHPYLGFNECALPLVLNHNTPNNSIPILWFPDDKIKGLFPRVKRHKDE